MSGSFTPIVDYDRISAYITAFETNFRMKAAKRESLCLPTFETIREWEGKEIQVPVITPHTKDDLAAPANRGADTTYSNTLMARRRITPSENEYAELIEWADLEARLTNPRENIYDAIIPAYNDWVDHLILSAAIGTAKQVYVDTSKVEQEESIALPNGNIYTNGTTGFTYNHFCNVEEIMRSNGVQVQYEPTFLFVGAKQNKEMKTDNVFKELIVQADHPFRTGVNFPKISNTWIIATNLLPTTTVDGKVYRKCIAYTPLAIEVAATELMTDVQPNAGKRHCASFFTRRVVGATRVDENRVVVLNCYENDAESPAS